MKEEANAHFSNRHWGATLSYAITLLQKSNQRIKLGLVRGRLLSNRHVAWMPFSELADCLILDEAEGKEDVGDELLLE